MKTDRRIRKTKKLLVQSLTKLMLEKKINSITVKELTDLADVNRSTFYLYYKDIPNMLETIETEMLIEFEKVFKEFTLKGSSNDNLLSFFTYLFEFVKVNSEMCKILLGRDGDYFFIEKLKEIIISQSTFPLKHNFSPIKLHYFIPFVISGCIGVIQQWLNDDMSTEAEKMAIILIELIVSM